jgi:heme exporter protein B
MGVVAWLVARKDLRIEFRSRVILWQVLPFGAIALILAGLAVGPASSSLRHAAPGIFYLVVLLVSLLAIGRSHGIEMPVGTRTSVRMLGLDPAGVFLGKALALFVELLGTSVVLVAGIVLFFHVPVLGALRATPSMLLALVSIAAAGTMYGALVADSKYQSTLLPVITLPPLAGVLIAGEEAFSLSLTGSISNRWVVFLAATAVAYLALGVLLYPEADES